MKISIHTDEDVDETQIEITCRELSPEVERLISMLRVLNMQLIGRKGEEEYILDVSRVLYIDTVDKKTFLYTKEEVYETPLRLYELEEQLTRVDFFRANKSCIINFRHIVSLRTDIDRRLRVTMSNKEQLIVSRQYAEKLKERLGLR